MRLLLISSLFLIFSCGRKTTGTVFTDADVVTQDKGKDKIDKDTPPTEPYDSLETYVVKENIKVKFSESKLLAPVLEQAEKEGKLVYLDINASWCTPCKLMQRDVYTNPNTASFINQNFVSHMVDIQKGEGPDLKVIYDIQVIPTLLWLDSKGHVLHRHEGALYDAGLINACELALSKKN
jgi:thiol:disulfide interchange protein